MSNEPVQIETSDRNPALLTGLISTIRRGVGRAGSFDRDVVVTGNLFKGKLLEDRSTRCSRK